VLEAMRRILSLAVRLDTLDARLTRISSQQGQVGAIEARLNSALGTVQTTRENYIAAESRIKDTDVASESANLVRSQILQQTATAILAQANQQPQIAVQLLR